MTHLLLASIWDPRTLNLWDAWLGWGTWGILWALTVALLLELCHHLQFGAAVDLSRRGAGNFSWPLLGETSHHSGPETRQGQGWRVETRCRRSGEQGSDFFDTVELDDDHLAFYLGEASGQGSETALYRASCQALLRFVNFTPGRPALALQEVNSVLCQRRPDGRFATLLYGVLRLSTGELSLVSAGQVDPVLQRADHVRRVLLPLQLPLGMVSSPNYQALTVQLSPGDRLLLVSDGVVRARDRNREPFSYQRLWAVSHTHRERDLAGWADSVMTAVDGYSATCAADRSVLALAYTGLA